MTWLQYLKQLNIFEHFFNESHVKQIQETSGQNSGLKVSITFYRKIFRQIPYQAQTTRQNNFNTMSTSFLRKPINDTVTPTDVKKMKNKKNK